MHLWQLSFMTFIGVAAFPSRSLGTALTAAGPTAAAAIAMDLLLPLLLQTGVATNGCVSQPGQYCVAVSGLSCTYQVLGSSFTCDSLGNTCDGKSPDCPASSGGGGGGGGTCVDPPAVDGATWDSSCSNGAASGGSCAATCDSGYRYVSA